MEKTATARRAGTSLALRALCEGAVMVVIAQILGYIKIWEMPWGGSVCLSMLPIFLYACRWGVRRGLMAGFVLGILQFMFDGGFALGWQSIIGDYLVAFTVLGLAGLFVGKGWSVFAGAVLGSVARFLVHYVVGATVWAEYMPEAFFGMSMTTPWFYSLLYNSVYMVLDMVLCLVVLGIMAYPLRRYFLGEDIRK